VPQPGLEAMAASPDRFLTLERRFCANAALVDARWHLSRAGGTPYNPYEARRCVTSWEPLTGGCFPMRIAVLCVAYVGDPTGIALLAEYFAAINADVYVHVDKKCDITPYAGLPAKYGNVHLLEDRTEYFWGGFNGARAVISALSFASRRRDYDRYIYITEDTAPLVHGRALLRLLAEDIELFTANLISEDWVRRRYDGFFYYDGRPINPRLDNQEDKEITSEFLHGIGRLTALRERGKYPLKDLYHGPAYFALTAKAIMELLYVCHNNEHLTTSFEFSAIPEEQYFQTILGNSANNYVFRPCILMDMSGDPRPFIYHTASELQILSTRGVPFARKIAASVPQVADFVRRLSDPSGGG
jgi:core-2/I-Branching enzyme